MSGHHFGGSDEPTDDALWELVGLGIGEERTDAMIQLAQRMYHRNDYADAASMQERLSDIFVEEDHPDDALTALARATGAWGEAEEWQNVEEVAVRAKALEDKAFSAESWRDYYASYAWAAHQRGAHVVALEFIDRAFGHADEMDSDHNRAMLLWQKGCIITTFGRLRQALEIFGQALEHARGANSIPLIIDILAESALIEVQLLNSQRAIELVTEAQTLLEECHPWPALRHRVGYALGGVYLGAGQFDEAIEAFESIVDELPTYPKIRTMIRLSECMFDKSAMWESRAYVLARNTNTWDLLNHLEINRAMKSDAALAIPVLDTVIARAVEYDDDVTRDAARLVLARKNIDLSDFPAAMDVLSRLSAVNFGDDMMKVITYLVLRAETLIELGDLVEARSIATALTRLEPQCDFEEGISEAFWQLATIEFDTNGPTAEWLRLAHSSIAHLAHTGNYPLLRERLDALQGKTRDSAAALAAPIATVDDLLADIRSEHAGFGEEAA